MDDIISRLMRELPDTDKDRYDIAYERGRAQARTSLAAGGLAIGLAAGAAVMFLFDPRLGRGRRIELRQRLNGALNGLRRTLAARREDIGNRAMGAATELGLPGTPPSNQERRAADDVAALRTVPRSSVAGRTTMATEPEPVAAVNDR
ncbi:MAG TPA: hypothetical protein VFU17_01300 [Candidatus Limnocylindrales bacterium]|nr:hypothetical protein [Candidatus Limnocylindrales bacterium]